MHTELEDESSPSQQNVDSLVDGVLTFVKSESVKKEDDKFFIDTKRDIRRLDKTPVLGKSKAERRKGFIIEEEEPSQRDFKPKMTLAERYMFDKEMFFLEPVSYPALGILGG